MTEYRTARPESLEQVFLCYTKDNLQDIAKKHGLKGFSKWNKKDLAKWLRDQLLDEAVMGEIVKQASADETRFFESAIQEHGMESERVYWGLDELTEAKGYLTIVIVKYS